MTIPPIEQVAYEKYYTDLQTEADIADKASQLENQLKTQIQSQQQELQETKDPAKQMHLKFDIAGEQGEINEMPKLIAQADAPFQKDADQQKALILKLD